MSHLYHYVLAVNQVTFWLPSLQNDISSEYTPLYYYSGAIFSYLDCR